MALPLQNKENFIKSITFCSYFFLCKFASSIRVDSSLNLSAVVMDSFAGRYAAILINSLVGRRFLAILTNSLAR